MSNEYIKNERQIKFLEPHVGGNLNDSNTQFVSQKKIINENNNLYLDLLDNTNDLLRNKDSTNTNFKSSEYIQEKRKEIYTRDTRINNFPTIVNEEINLSNPIIYPKDYDPYFEYLYKKNLNSINTQVIQKKNYVNIDSVNRITNSTMNVLSYTNLISNPLIFKNESDVLQIKFQNATDNFSVGDRITLRGYDFYTVDYKKLNFFFKNQSNQVIIDLVPNYIYEIPYYNVMIEISGITNNNSDYFKNIPLNVLNDIHTVSIYTTSSNEYKLSFEMPLNFYSENVNSTTFSSNCLIKYYFIGNYPINYINSGLPTSLYNLNSYLIIDSLDNNNIYVKLTNPISLINSSFIPIYGNWLNNTTFETGGNFIQVGLITSIEQGYPNTSKYKLILDKKIDNVVCIRMKSSEIPNTYKLIYNISQNSKQYFKTITSNNMFYWENALDKENNIYNIQIPAGNYSSIELSNLMEELINKVPRIINEQNIIPLNKIKININQSNNITQLTSFNQYKLPKCIINLNNSNEYTWILTINHPNHNQNVGNKIIIEKCINYKNIDKNYINGEHIISQVINNDMYNITLKNINLLPYYNNENNDETNNTNGGNNIIISTLNPFRIYFDKSNTIGAILGFKNIGQPGSITPFSNSHNNYIIDNSQAYIFGIENIQIVNNSLQNVQVSNDFSFDVGRYILIKCADDYLNQCTTPNGISYFYKIQLNGQPGSMMFNTFVDNPIYFNPPIKYLEYFDFTFMTESAIEFEFYGINNSMTFEISSITNSPENTNLATYVARI